MEACRMGGSRLAAVFLAAACNGAAFAADWASLERYQQTITRAEFDTLLSQVYSPSSALTNYLTFTTNSVAVYSAPTKVNPPVFTLRFGTASKLQTTNRNPRICLDPGHI